MSVEITGFDGVDDLGERLESLENEVPMQHLFTSEFMESYTDFDDFSAFLEASAWTVETQTDFERIPEREFDEYVAEHTGFDSWGTMLRVAGREYLMQRPR